MAIRPPSDIVLDVARAADPSRVAAAVKKLDAADAGTDFAALLAPAREAVPRGDGPGGVSARLTHMSWPGAAAQAGTTDPYRKFESFVLQMFLQTMMPKGASSVFGKGSAGDVYRSMMAEQLAGQFARGGGIGLARALATSRALGATAAASPSASDTKV